jgi:outer membrane protein assembly factor BamA
VRGVAQFELGPRLLTVSAAGSNPQGTLVQPIDDVWNGCSAQAINAGTCDAGQLAENRRDAFDIRPVGGAALIEGNVELRFPVWGENLRGAAFVDAGEIWPDGSDLRAGAWAVTPGLGMRYFSPVGPIRIDVGYNGSTASRLDVFTNEVCELDTCDPIEEGRVYRPEELQNSGRIVQLPAIRWNPYDSFFDRLQLHFSIGQAF